MSFIYTDKEALIVQEIKNQTSKRNGIIAVNIVIPLVFGVFIYLTKAERTYISDILSAFRSVLPIIIYPEIIRDYACDFLWAYALFFCLSLSLGDKLKGEYNLVVIAMATIVAVSLETIQLNTAIPGTFDPWDIVVELIAIATANLNASIIERRFKSYEEE